MRRNLLSFFFERVAILLFVFSPSLEDLLPLESPDDGDAGHGRGEVVQHWGLCHVLQLPGPDHPAVHEVVHREEAKEDQEEGRDEPRVQDANQGDLKEGKGS